MIVLLAACLADIQFGPNSGQALPAGHAPTQVLLVDLDHDGRLDALVAELEARQPYPDEGEEAGSERRPAEGDEHEGSP